MTEEQKTKKMVRKIEKMTPELAERYDLKKNEALERLREKNISDSEQMLNKWARDGEIDAVRIAKGHPRNRGIRISSKSLEAFIIKKNGDVQILLDENEKLKDEIKKLKSEIKQLKDSGLRKPRTKSANLKDVFAAPGNILHFKYDRAKHAATFDKDGNIKKVERNTRTGKKDVTAKLDDAVIEAIIKERKKRSH